MILLIETSSTICSAAISDIEGNCIWQIAAEKPNAHSEKLAVMVGDLMNKLKEIGKQLVAVAISRGPGSYTGLRIGTSLAKGICFSLNIPLISSDSFYGMAMFAGLNNPNSEIIISMLDARRDDVYLKVFDADGNVVKKMEAVTLNPDILGQFNGHKLLICGNSNEKWRRCVGENAGQQFMDMEPDAEYLITETINSFNRGVFEDLAYYEPYYLKDFVPGMSKKFVL